MFWVTVIRKPCQNNSRIQVVTIDVSIIIKHVKGPPNLYLFGINFNFNEEHT